MSNNVMNVAHDNKLVVINLHIAAMAADRQIDLKALGINVEELPNASRKLLAEKIFPKDFLRAYGRIRENGEALVASKGAAITPMGAVGGRSDAVEKIAVLKELNKEWEKQKEEDKLRYQGMCSEHILKVSQEALKAGSSMAQVDILVKALVAKQPTWEEVESKLVFKYTCTVISMEESNFDADLFDAQRDSVIALREGVMGSLVQHTCREAKEILDNLAEQEKSKKSGDLRVNPRTVKRVWSLIEKLEGLVFVHKLIAPLHQELRLAMQNLPMSGALTGNEYHNFKECLKCLRDQTIVWDRLKQGLPLIAVQPAQPAVQQVASQAATQQTATPQVSVPSTVSTPVAAPAQPAPVQVQPVPVQVTQAPAQVAVAPQGTSMNLFF